MKRKEQEVEAPKEDLVPMVKDGEEIEVHPSCVKAHEAAGWRKKG